MKILKTTLCALSMLLLVPMTAQSQEQESLIMNLTTYTIKFGHDVNFREGVKKWNKCYKDNNGTDTYNIWHRVQGEGNVYVVSSKIKNWAEMDKTDAAGKACHAVALDFVVPHIESVKFNTTKTIPEFSSNAPLGDRTIVWVTDFKVNDDDTFNDIVKDVTSTIKKKEGDARGYWYAVMGGQGADYFVSSPYKNFAALDVKRDGVWKVYESVNGKAKTDDIRKKFRASIDDIWSYTYTLEKDLSNQ
ncbi:MAG: hypothetical protein R2812_08040 [Gelidibacter sp.]|nr:hypothetical protein [Gelidibacter sp.]